MQHQTQIRVQIQFAETQTQVKTIERDKAERHQL